MPGMMARRRIHLLWQIPLAVLALLVVALVAVYWYYRPMLLTGTGYAAHNACALKYLQDREDAATDLPPNPLVPYVTVSYEEQAVTSRVLGVFAPQTAYHTPGFGCTLADERPEMPVAAKVSTTNRFAEASTPQTPPALAEAMEPMFADELNTRAVLVVHEGELIAERYAEGWDATVPQLGWSMSKSATHLLVGRAVQEAGIDIDRSGLRQEWATDQRSGITLDHLLKMTPGLSWDETYDLGTPITEMLFKEPDMGGFVASQELEHPPGEFYEYSTGFTNLICRVLVDDLDAGANLPREMLFQPLGLSSAVWETDATGAPACGSYMWATPSDWAALGQFALDDGVVDGERLLPEGWMAEALTPIDQATDEEWGYGRSWWLNTRADGSVSDPTLPADVFSARGHDGQFIYVSPHHDLVVVRMGFTPNSDSKSMGVDQFVADAIEWVESKD